MSNQAVQEGRSVALYWDFENLHAGLSEEKEPGSYGRENRFKLQEPLVDVQAVADLAASFGPVAINRGYCNWQFFGRYREALLHNAVELVQLFPPGGAAKNGADIRLCLDAMEDLARFPHVGTVVIVGGDSDFLPISHKVKAAGRTLVGVGTRRSTNRHWARSCDEFRYYETLVPSAPDAAAQADAPAALLRRALRVLADRQSDAWVDEAMVLPMIRRLDSTFDPRDHGHAGFAAMVETLDALLETRPGPAGRQLRLK